MNNWMDTVRIKNVKSHSNDITWPYDKYPDRPQLLAGASVTMLEAEGPGVVTNMHVACYNPLQCIFNDDRPADPKAGSRIIIRVWYDGAAEPAIDMPLMDFLGDVDGEAAFYATKYFAKVKMSHNFRMPMPFEKSIKIVLTNPTDTDLIGAADIQWDTLPELPADCGYLYAERRSGKAMLPEEVITLADIKAKGKIAAQWYHVAADVPEAANGEYICEGNQEFYLDGGEEPAVLYTGTEDCYGYSWGFAGIQSDGYEAIIKKEALPGGGADIAMLRCRTEDAISFDESCLLKVDYSKDFYTVGTTNPWHETPVFKARHRFSFEASWSACTYWYQTR